MLTSTVRAGHAIIWPCRVEVLEVSLVPVSACAVTGT